MAVVVVSDLHLQGPTHAAQQDFLRFLDGLRDERIVVAGDLFDLWIVPSPDAIPSAARPVVDALREREALWLAGNHDPRPGALGLRVATYWRRGGVVVVHGDDLERPGNRILKGLIGSGAARLCARWIGMERTFQLGVRLASSRRGRYTEEGLQRALQRQRMLADRYLVGAHTVLFGHSHAPGVEQRPGGRWINLGDWYEHRSFALVEGEEVRLLRWSGGRVEPLVGPPRRRLHQGSQLGSGT